MSVDSTYEFVYPGGKGKAAMEIAIDTLEARAKLREIKNLRPEPKELTRLGHYTTDVNWLKLYDSSIGIMLMNYKGMDHLSLNFEATMLGDSDDIAIRKNLIKICEKTAPIIMVWSSFSENIHPKLDNILKGDYSSLAENTNFAQDTFISPELPKAKDWLTKTHKHKKELATGTFYSKI